MSKRRKDNDKDNEKVDLIQGYNFGEDPSIAFRNFQYNSTNKGGNGRLFGFEVDSSTQMLLDLAYKQFLPYAYKQVRADGSKFIADLAVKLGNDENVSKAFGEKLNPYLSGALFFAEPIVSLGATGVDAATRLNEVRKSLSPIAKSSGKYASLEAIFGSNNEVVSNARKKIWDSSYASIAGIFARVVASVPSFVTVSSRYKVAPDAQEGKKASEGGEIIDHTILTLSSVIGTKLDQWLVGGMREELEKPTALDLIGHLGKAIAEDPQSDSIPNFGDSSGDSSYTNYVHQIFQRNQLDSKKIEVGTRFFQNLKQENFRDEKIFHIDDDQLSTYEVAIKHIAKALKSGEMNAASLINLVGQRKIVQKDGKHFGPKGSNGRREGVIEEINKQCACVDSHKSLSHEQISEILSNIVLTEEDLKNGFAGGGFKGEERAFMFMLLESQIHDLDALKKITGLSEAEMKPLREESKESFAKHFDSAILAIASMSNEQLSELAKHEITIEEIKLIREAAGAVKKTGKHIGDLVDSDAKQQLETAVVNALGAAEKETGGNFWQEKIKKQAARSAKDAIQEALKQESPDSPLARINNDRNADTPDGAHLGMGA